MSRGTIYWRKGWVVQLSIGTDDAGKRKRITRKAKACREHDEPLEACRACRKRAEQLLTALLAEHDARPVQPHSATVHDFLTLWLREHATQVRPSTLSGYEGKLAKHVIPRIGTLPLTELTTPVLNDLYRTLTEDLSHSTVRQVSAILSRALRDAVAWSYLGTNPATQARLPRRADDDPNAPETKVRAFTVEELRAFLASVEGGPWADLFYIAAATGMRRSELLGLRWDAVDLEAAEVRVVRTLHRVAGEWVWGSPKTAKSRRTIRLAPRHAARLRAIRAAQAEERLQAGPAWTQDPRWEGLVFTDETGEPKPPTDYSAAMTRVCKREGLPEIGLHGLRHTYATLLIEAGVPLPHVSKQLGHSTTSFTADVYGHLTDTMGNEAAAAIDRVLGG